MYGGPIKTEIEFLSNSKFVFIVFTYDWQSRSPSLLFRSQEEKHIMIPNVNVLHPLRRESKSNSTSKSCIEQFVTFLI